MPADDLDIDHLARIARIAIPDAIKVNVADDIGRIINWVEQLANVNTENVSIDPLIGELMTPHREDIIDEVCETKVLLSNSVISADGCFAVPTVID